MFTCRRLALIILILPVGSTPDARTILSRTLTVTGFSQAQNRVLHFNYATGAEQPFQSVPPFATIVSTGESWFDPVTGVERRISDVVSPGNGPTKQPVILTTASTQFVVRNGLPAPFAGSPTFERDLNLWAVLWDWSKATDIVHRPDALFRDYRRSVLERAGPFGSERLFIDPKTGFPVKLERVEPHYLWGQVSVEYTFDIWRREGAIFLPTACARLVDGFKELTRTIGPFGVAADKNLPDMNVPSVSLPPSTLPTFLQPTTPVKVDISPRVFLTTNSGYTESIALIGGTVFVFDATQGEARARADFELIRHTFGGHHPIVVVVSDLAWPHVAGVRYWVSSGATIVSHRSSRPFLERVIARRWTRDPDLLEQHRPRPRLNFIPVDATRQLATGRVILAAIDGIGSERAIMAYLPDDQFLWASDFIQSTTSPSTYTFEVWQAAQRLGLKPRTVAAMHLPATKWSVIEELLLPYRSSDPFASQVGIR